MKITLTVEQSSDPTLAGAQVTFDGDGGTLGRAADNDWVLPDPNCYTSGCHARVRRDGNGFLVEDLSTNGTFHNSPDKLIGKQRTAPLVHGDRLYVGEFVIRVAIETPAEDVPESDDDLSSELSESLPPPQAEERDEFDDLLEGTGRPEPQPPLSTESTDSFEGHQSSGLGALDLDDDDQGDDARSSDQAAADYQQSPEREYFSAPRMGSDAADDIPDEWDALLTGFFEPPASAKPGGSAKPSPGADSTPASKEQAESDGPSPATGSPQRPRPSLSQPQPRPAARSSFSGADQADVVARIMHELGIGEAAGEVDADDFAEQVGKVVRMVGEGLMQLLASRAEIKNEFRIDQTRIASSRNNPLKFSPTIEEAMRRVFVERDVPGFISGAESFEQALNDLRAHQMAILAAVQGAIESVIRQFNPADLESKLKKISPISASAPLIREAKCWNLFTSHYEDMAANLRQDAKQVFVREFAEAYERSSREIAQQIAQKQKAEP